MAIVLVRHGETALNRSLVVQPPDTPLSERGLAQAARLGERLRAHRVGRILSSDLPRALMTAEAVSQVQDVPCESTALLQERNFGDIRGTPYAELTANIFGADYEPPNGESLRVFHERVARAWQAVCSAARQTPDDIVVVTHGLVCRALVRRHLQVQGDMPQGWSNASVTLIDREPPYRVQLINCVRHLHGLDEQGALV